MDDSTTPPALTFPIIGIGASAGGLDALAELLSALPAVPGMAFLVIQHLDPVHASVLAELLTKHTALPVKQVQDGEPVAINHVYVIAPNTVFMLASGKLHVGGRAPLILQPVRVRRRGDPLELQVQGEPARCLRRRTTARRWDRAADTIACQGVSLGLNSSGTLADATESVSPSRGTGRERVRISSRKHLQARSATLLSVCP